MNIYCAKNFANVLIADDLKNHEALIQRKIYIEQQLDKGLSEKLSISNNDNINGPFWLFLIQKSQNILELVNNEYRKHQDDASVIFQLEQVLGRLEFLFDQRHCSTDESYKENILQIEALSAQLSGHQSKPLKNIGILLMVVSITAVMALMLIVSFSTLGGVFLGSLLGLGLLAMSSGLFIHDKGRHKGLSLATNELATKASNTHITLDYFEKSISPKLYNDDYLELKKELVYLLNKGFDPIVLKKALIWANSNYNQMNCSDSTSYEIFFRRVTDVCCCSMNENHWIQYVRILNLHSKALSKTDLNHFKSENKNSKPFFPFFYRSTEAITLKYFDEFISVLLSEHDQPIFKEGLKRLLNSGSNPSMLKDALEWSRAKYDYAHVLCPTELENSNDFFNRTADICGVVLASSVYVHCL